MLVSVALLAFIVLGLTAMFVQTQKAFKIGIKQTSSTDAGRSVIDMIANDFAQLSNQGFTNNWFPPLNWHTLSLTPAQSMNYGASPICPPNLYWSLVQPLSFNQVVLNNGVTTYRTNQSEDIFMMVQTNAVWTGIGYSVSNWFTNAFGGAFPGVGTLYRFTAITNVPLDTNNLLFTNFYYQTSYGTFTNTFFHRIADGIVHLKIIAYDADGNEMSLEPAYDVSTSTGFMQYPYIKNVTNSITGVVEQDSAGNYILQTNVMPHSIDIELGVLDPEAIEHARALYTSGAANAAGNYLTNAAGQVQIFRKHIVIAAAQ